jgi:hypothetical protein
MLSATGKTRPLVHRYLRYGIIEDLDSVRHIQLGRLGGVRLSITPIAWLSPLVFFALRLLIGLLAPGMSQSERLYDALLFTIAVQVANPLHALGHILSGKLVRGAMDELLITATRDVNLYAGDQRAIPSHVHLGRALGGPVFNLLMAGIFYAVLPFIPIGVGHTVVERIASMNLFFGAGGFLPLPSIDGEVIWRELLRPLRNTTQPKK